MAVIGESSSGSSELIVEPPLANGSSCSPSLAKPDENVSLAGCGVHEKPVAPSMSVFGASSQGSSGSSVSTNWDRVKTAKITMDLAKKKLKENPVDFETCIDLLDQVCVVLKEELGDLNVETCDALYYYGSTLLESYQIGSDLMGNKATIATHQYATVGDGTDIAAPTSSGSQLQLLAKDTRDPTTQGELITLIDATPSVEDGGGMGDCDVDCDSSNASDLESLPGGGPLADLEENNISDDENNDGTAIDTSAVTDPCEINNIADTDLRRSFGAGKAASTEGDSIAELRYAWEILEIARVGYEKRMQEGAPHGEKIRLSDIHYKLSLCAAENGEQNVAIVEAERSLKVCQEACDPTDRDLAEAFFNLGSVYSMYSLLSEAADNMKKAVAILEARKVQANLKLFPRQPETEGDVADNTIDRKALEKELGELNELIPDLMQRIQDTYEDMRLGTDEAKRLLDNWLKGVSDKCHTDAGVPVDSPPPVNDISHLVRRVQPKRPSAADEEESTKRLKGMNGTAVEMPLSQVSNGKATSNPDMDIPPSDSKPRN